MKLHSIYNDTELQVYTFLRIISTSTNWSVSVVVKDIALGTRGHQWLDTTLTLLWNCVALAINRGDGHRHSLHALAYTVKIIKTLFLTLVLLSLNNKAMSKVD